MKLDPYINNPVYETDLILLRLVKLSDAEDLLLCYSDAEAVGRMNADNCTSDFHFKTLEEMEGCIRFWQEAYEKRYFIRFAIIMKESGKAIGTVECFSGQYGVLRIDLASQYEDRKYLEGLLQLAIFQFVSDFGIERLVIKASNIPERLGLLEEYGFQPSEEFRPGFGYYERHHDKLFNRDMGLAYCGLACCVCSESETCVGCRKEGCKDKDWCKSFQCCKTKGMNGCWECNEFPCDNPMFAKLRIRTFAKFIGQYGEEQLMDALEQYDENGVKYHYPGQLRGDYDLIDSEDKLTDLLNRTQQMS